MWNFNEGRGGLAFQWRKEGLFNKRSWKIWLSTWKKNDFGSHPYTILKNQLQMDWELKCQKQTLKHSVAKYRWISFRPWGRDRFLKQAKKEKKSANQKRKEL